MQEFTFKIFIEVLKKFLDKDYEIKAFVNHINDNESSKYLILRHDVDRFPGNALKMAIIEAELGIKSTYFFRTIPSVLKPVILNKIIELGHEIGYHYEDLAQAKGNIDAAIKSFQSNLCKLRSYYPIKTICMHGSPLSKYDNKNLWKHYNYKDFGILADTSMDINYNEVFYISDNGFGWNKTSTSIRDKVSSKYIIPINNTKHLIELIETNKLPLKIMLNAHPDTFNDFGIKWLLNYSFIKSKNIIKWGIVKSKLIK